MRPLSVPRAPRNRHAGRSDAGLCIGLGEKGCLGGMLPPPAIIHAIRRTKQAHKWWCESFATNGSVRDTTPIVASEIAVALADLHVQGLESQKKNVLAHWHLRGDGQARGDSGHASLVVHG